MVEVHHFKIRNNTKGDWEILPSKRTAKSISELQDLVIPETAEEVDPTLIDGQGRYFPAGAAVQMEKPMDMGTLKRKQK